MQRPLTFKLIVDYFLYLLVRLVDEVFNLLPERAALATARFFGRVAFVILPDRRAAALENLTIAFGKEQSRQWIFQTARKNFEHLGMLTVEFFRIRRWTHGEMARRIVIDGARSFNLAMLPGNHGICLLNSHFGCFEVSAATTKFLGIRLNLIQTGMKNPFISRYFFTRAGEETGIKAHPHRGVVKTLLKCLHDGEMVAFLADQRGDAERGIFVDFFGTKAPANEVFARLAMESGARVLPLCTYRRDDGNYQSIFEDEIRIELTGDRHHDLTAISQQFHDLFEKWLRLHPEQGFWVHRKWRRKGSHKRAKGRVPNKAAAEASRFAPQAQVGEADPPQAQ